MRIDQLFAAGVEVQLIDPDKIRIVSDRPISQGLVEEIARSKPQIIDELRRKCAHLDPAQYRDEVDGGGRIGWIRTTCRKCGRFVGYRTARG